MRCPRCGWRFGGITKDLASDIRKMYPRAFLAWSPEDDERLLALTRAGHSLVDLAKALQRQPSAVHRRLGLLGLSLASSTTDQSSLTPEDELEFPTEGTDE